MESKPLEGLRVGIIQETLGEGVDNGIVESIQAAALHLDHLGARVSEVILPSIVQLQNSLSNWHNPFLSIMFPCTSGAGPSNKNMYMDDLQVSMPSFSLGLPAYYILAASEASSNLSRYDGVR